MRTVMYMFIIVNALLIVSFVSSVILEFKNNSLPRLKAKISVITAVLLLSYLFLTGLASVLGILEQEYLSLLLLPFAASPFIIGNYVQYKTLKKYSIIQILCFVGSLVTVVSVI